MTILTEINLKRCCEVAMTRASWREVMASCDPPAAESLAYNWLSRSKHDAEAHLEGASPFWIDIAPTGFDYWHNHMKRSRSAFIVGMEAEVRDQVRSGIVEVCYNPSDGRPLLALNPEFIGVSDAEMEAEFLNPAIDRYLWNRDAEGKRTTPILQVKVTQAPGQLKIKALSALLPQTYGERATVDHNVMGAVVHTFQPAPFVSKQARIESGEVTEGEFVEIQNAALERPDIAELRARAARLQADLPNRRTVPDAPVMDANGQPITGRPRVIVDAPDDVPLPGKPETTLRDNRRSYMRPSKPAPAQQRSQGGFPPHSDPRNGKAMRITR